MPNLWYQCLSNFCVYFTLWPCGMILLQCQESVMMQVV